MCIYLKLKWKIYLPSRCVFCLSERIISSREVEDNSIKFVGPPDLSSDHQILKSTCYMLHVYTIIYKIMYVTVEF